MRRNGKSQSCKRKGRRPSRDTNAQNRLLLTLAQCHCATAQDITGYLRDSIDQNAIRNTNKTLSLLVAKRLVNWLPLPTPCDYETGALPKVWGLSETGVAYAQTHFQTDPVEFKKDRSLLTFVHDLKCARFQLRLAKWCDQNGFEFYSQKTDLKRSVDPDRLFAVYDPATESRVFLFYEEENKKKTHEALFDKCKPYYDLYGTERCAKEWGEFSDFKVIFQFASEVEHDNFLDYLAGVCHCSYRRGVLKHTCRRAAPLKASMFWFTTDTQIDRDLGGRIFRTPGDHKAYSYSFLDVIAGFSAQNDSAWDSQHNASISAGELVGATIS